MNIPQTIKDLAIKVDSHDGQLFVVGGAVLLTREEKMKLKKEIQDFKYKRLELNPEEFVTTTLEGQTYLLKLIKVFDELD